MRFREYSEWKCDAGLVPGESSGSWRCSRRPAHPSQSAMWRTSARDVNPVMDAMADARVKVVISVPRAPRERTGYAALIGPTVAGLFAAAQL